MSTKYTTLGSSDDHRNDVSEIPPLYELDNIEAGPSREVSSAQPLRLNVRFYQEVDKTIDFPLNYYPHLGVRGIHDMVKRKLDSMGIELDDENYLIGVLQFVKFRLITVDDDSTGNNIHYFKSLQLALIESAEKFRQYIYIGSTLGIPILSLVAVIIFAIVVTITH